eukprot:SAG31_NODE_447_length_15579_cov_5.713871_2_plen_72_part_00
MKNLRPCVSLQRLSVSCLGGGASRQLGDDGLVSLAAVLPPTLTWLDATGIECGDAGAVALAAVLPSLASLR